MPYLTYESLILTDRVVRIKHRLDPKHGSIYYFAIALAGEYPKAGPAPTAVLLFGTKRGAYAAKAILETSIRRAVKDLRIKTDRDYNQAVMRFVEAAASRGEQLEHADQPEVVDPDDVLTVDERVSDIKEGEVNADGD